MRVGRRVGCFFATRTARAPPRSSFFSSERAVAAQLRLAWCPLRAEAQLEEGARRFFSPPLSAMSGPEQYLKKAIEIVQEAIKADNESKNEEAFQVDCSPLCPLRSDATPLAAVHEGVFGWRRVPLARSSLAPVVGVV